MLTVSSTAELGSLPTSELAEVLVRDDDPGSWTPVPPSLGAGRNARIRIHVCWRRHRSAADLRLQIAASGLGRVDALILEEPVCTDGGQSPWFALLKAWRQMEALHRDGLVGALGLRDGGRRTLDALRAAATVPPTWTIVEYQPYLQDPALIEYCHAQNITVCSHDPLASPDTLRLHGVVPPESDPTVLAIAAEHGKDPRSVCVAWCIAKGIVPLLPSGITPAAVILTPADVARMDALHRDCRLHADQATLTAIYGNFSEQPLQVLDPERQAPGEDYFKILYAQLTPWESVNRIASHLLWRFFFNLPDTLEYLVARLRGLESQSPLQRRLLSDLNRLGYTRTSLDELGLGSMLEQFQAGADQVEQWALTAKAKGQYPLRVVDPRFAPLETGVLKQIADRYAGTRLVARNTYTMANAPIEIPAGAQRLWHTDVEDYYVLKVYVLLTPIDDFSGPLDYVDATHPKGRFATTAARLMKHTFRKPKTWLYDYQIPDDLLYRAVRPRAVTRIAGQVGDVLLFDARGIHRGGHTLSRTRRVGVISFTGRNTIHNTFPPTTRWGRICARFAWKTNVCAPHPAPTDV